VHKRPGHPWDANAGQRHSLPPQDHAAFASSICVRNMLEKTLECGHILNTMAAASSVENLNFRHWFAFRPDHLRMLQRMKMSWFWVHVVSLADIQQAASTHIWWYRALTAGVYRISVLGGLHKTVMN